MTWLETARKVVSTHGALFVYTDTAKPIGNPKSEVLMRDLETEGELEDVARNPKAQRRLRSSRRVLLDMTTASMLCQIYDALSDANKAHFASLPLMKAVSVGWKLCR